MTEALLVHGHKVQVEVLVELVNAGLVVVSVEKLARPAIEVARLTITDKGRQAIGLALKHAPEETSMTATITGGGRAGRKLPMAARRWAE